MIKLAVIVAAVLIVALVALAWGMYYKIFRHVLFSLHHLPGHAARLSEDWHEVEISGLKM